MLIYPVRITPDGDQFMAQFRDIPEALTGDDTIEDTKMMAEDALATAMEFYFDDRRPVPMPSEPEEGEALIELSETLSLKVMLLNLMLENNVRPVDLAKKLNTKPQTVTRILDLKHNTKIDQLSDAFKALGKKLNFFLA